MTKRLFTRRLRCPSKCFTTATESITPCRYSSTAPPVERSRAAFAPAGQGRARAAASPESGECNVLPGLVGADVRRLESTAGAGAECGVEGWPPERGCCERSTERPPAAGPDSRARAPRAPTSQAGRSHTPNRRCQCAAQRVQRHRTPDAACVSRAACTRWLNVAPISIVGRPNTAAATAISAPAPPPRCRPASRERFP